MLVDAQNSPHQLDVLARKFLQRVIRTLHGDIVVVGVDMHDGGGPLNLWQDMGAEADGPPGQIDARTQEGGHLLHAGWIPGPQGMPL